ncbi:hypothetical protein ACWKSP_01160 [Micromonosporaceae bacterium Da 78-11]
MISCRRSPAAIVVHLRRHESSALVVNLVLLALAGFVAWGRFGS